MRYKFTDKIVLEIGANIFLGEKLYAFFWSIRKQYNCLCGYSIQLL